MSWKWTAPAPRALTLDAGSQSVVVLPLAGEGTCSVEWDCSDLPGARIETDPSDPARASLDLPPGLHGFFPLRYRVAGLSHDEETIRIRVVAPAPEPIDTGAGESPAESAEPEPLVHAAGLEMLRRHRDEEEDETDAPDAPADLPSPLPHGRYSVDVIRRDVRVEALRRAVEPGSTMTIGRLSARTGTLPVLDLSGQFGSEDDERCCSHLQAEVYWQEDRIVLLNRGRNPSKLVTAGGEQVELDGLHLWQPGQRIALPGGALQLELIREDGS